MPLTRPVDKPTITAEQINSLMEAIEDPHDLCLMAIGLFCATRTSETFGLQWKSYQQDKLIIQTTAFEGRLYNRVKNEASRSAVPILEDIRPIIEAWRRGVCPDSSPDALMFPTLGSRARRNEAAAASQKLLKWRIYPITDKLGIPRKLVTFQVMRRTLGRTCKSTEL